MLVAFGLMIYDWRYGARRNDGANAALALFASIAAFWSISLLHIQYTDWLFAPIAYVLLASFSKERKASDILLSVFVLAFSIGIVGVENLADAYHPQRYHWPIGLAGAATLFVICWIIGRVRTSHVKSLP